MTLLSNKLKSLGLSQKELSERLGVSQPYISAVLSGKILKINATKKFATEFGFNLMDLLSDFENQEQITVQKKNENCELPESQIKRNHQKWFDTIQISKVEGLNLVRLYFSSSSFNKLKKGKIEIASESSDKYYEVEYCGESMENGTKSIVDFDWFLASEVKREEWNNIKINTEWNVFYFSHNELGHFLAEISSYGILGELNLKFWNHDKSEYPDLVVNVKDSYIIAKITDLIRRNYLNAGARY